MSTILINLKCITWHNCLYVNICAYSSKGAQKRKRNVFFLQEMKQTNLKEKTPRCFPSQYILIQATLLHMLNIFSWSLKEQDISLGGISVLMNRKE